MCVCVVFVFACVCVRESVCRSVSVWIRSVCVCAGVRVNASAHFDPQHTEAQWNKLQQTSRHSATNHFVFGSTLQHTATHCKQFPTANMHSLYICTYIYVDVYIYIYINTYIFKYTHTYKYIYIYIHIYMFTHMYIDTYTNANAHIHTHTYILFLCSHVSCTKEPYSNRIHE